MAEEYYKVVWENEGYHSALIDAPELAVDYVVGEWVYPKLTGTPLLVYGERQPALDFVAASPHYAVFVCEVIKPRATTVMPDMTCEEMRAHQDRVVEAWHTAMDVTNGSGRLVPGLTLAPDGTVVCDAVKLLWPVTTD
jgi:hypothetical protein